MMMMVSDDCLVECQIDDDELDDEEFDDEEQMTPPPPPEFASDSRALTPPIPLALETRDPYSVENRDPYGINRHLQVEFNDILAEPISPRSADRVWVYTVVGFETAKVWIYRCLSVLCAVPLALLSGCLLALLACVHIWCVMPCVQVCHSCLPCVRSLWMSVVNIFISPFCSSVARCCSQISVSLAKDN